MFQRNVTGQGARAGAPEVRLAAKNEARIRAEKVGEERRLSTVSAGAGGVVAVIVRVIGGG